MRRKIIAANWKMNGSIDLVKSLVSDVRESLATLDNGVEVVIIPPALFVSAVKEQLSGSDISLGVQNISRWSSGAYTGELSADMVSDCGCGYALIGHSERRELFGETDSMIAEKVARALEANVNLILCVGETLTQRDAGLAEEVVSAQLKEALKGVSGPDWKRVVVAYEPVWAIGTGKTATAEDAQAVHASMREVLGSMSAPASDISLLYGGSVKPDNAIELFAQPDVDGGLIGGASLNAPDFIAICKAV